MAAKMTVGRVMVQFRKNRPATLTDFGASLQSTLGAESVHSLIEVDMSGLAWEAGFRNNDVIEAVNATELAVKGVSHHSLLEYLRDTGRTCTMLIRRRGENAADTYFWIAFKDKKEGRVPKVAKRTKRSVGSDISQADAVYHRLPRWARRIPFSTLKFQYDSTRQIRLVWQKGSRDQYLGFYVDKSSLAQPKFTKNTFILKMHTYKSVNASVEATVLAFSAIPRSSAADRIDDLADDGEESIFGNTSGPVKLVNFPSWMTNRDEQIMANPRMFRWSFNNDQTGLLSSALNETEELYVSGSSGQACLGTKRDHLIIREMTSSSETTTSMTSIYPRLNGLEI